MEICGIVFVQCEYFVNDDSLCKTPVSRAAVLCWFAVWRECFAQVFCLRAVFLFTHHLRFVGNDRWHSVCCLNGSVLDFFDAPIPYGFGVDRGPIGGGCVTVSDRRLCGVNRAMEYPSYHGVSPVFLLGIRIRYLHPGIRFCGLAGSASVAICR